MTALDHLGFPADAPAALRARALTFVDAPPAAAGALPAERLLDGGVRALEQALSAPPRDRTVALDVLTADALVTRAMELFAALPGDFEAECARCIGKLSVIRQLP